MEDSHEVGVSLPVTLLVEVIVEQVNTNGYELCGEYTVGQGFVLLRE